MYLPKTYPELVALLIIVINWLAGIALANPGGATFVACVIPPYSWYLVVEMTMKKFGLI